MLPFNLDLLDVAVIEQQERIQTYMMRARAGYHGSHPFRRMIGRLLVWGGRQVGGDELVQPVSAPSVTTVVSFDSRHPRRELDSLERAA